MIYFLGPMRPPGTKRYSLQNATLYGATPTLKAPDQFPTYLCRYCGEPAAETINEEVVIGASEVFKRRYSTCGLCTSLRRNGLGLDPSWSAEDTRPTLTGADPTSTRSSA